MQTIIKRAFGLRGVFTLLALMLTLSVSAQNKITGRVVDETDQPAIGANVVIAGTTQCNFAWSKKIFGQFRACIVLWTKFRDLCKLVKCGILRYSDAAKDLLYSSSWA